MTIKGINESLPPVSRSKHTGKEAIVGHKTKLKPHGVGLQVPHRMDTEMAKEGAVRETAHISWYSV